MQSDKDEGGRTLPKGLWFRRGPLALGLGAVAFLVMFLFSAANVGVFDEGIVLTGAREVTLGAVPHRDFYANYGPAHFYLTGMWFELFGTNVVALRLLDSLVRAAIVAIVFGALDTRTERPTALIIAGAAALWLLGIQTYGYVVFPVTLLSLLGTLLLLRALQGDSARIWIGAAGAVSGLAALFRYDAGPLLLLAHSATVMVLVYRPEDRLASARRFVELGLFYGLGLAVGFLPLAGWMIASGAIPGFLYDIIAFTGHHYFTTRYMPPPLNLLRRPEAVAVYIPFIAVALAAVALLHGRARKRMHFTDRTFPATVAFAFLSAAMAAKGMVRIQPVHMAMAIIPALVLLGLLLNALNEPGGRRRLTTMLGIILAVFPGVAQASRAVIGFLQGSTSPMIVALARPHDQPSPFQGFMFTEPDIGCIMRIMMSQTKGDDRIYVGPGRHDKLFLNRMEVYFLTGRRPGTHWAQIDPGLQSQDSIQREMIQELSQARVRWIIRDTFVDDVMEPNDSARSSGVTLLDEWISTNFHQVAGQGTASLWSANGVQVQGPHIAPNCAGSR